MRTRNYFAKALSLALAFVMILCNFQSLQVFAEDAENDNVNLGISNVATPAVTSIKENKLQLLDESLELDALEVAGSISFKLSADDFNWEDEAPSVLRKDILDANNVTIGYALDKGAELFNGIDFYEPDNVDHIRLDFNSPVDGESNEFEYFIYLMQDGVIAEGTRTSLKGQILQSDLSIRTFDALLAQNETKVLAGSGYSAAVEQDGSFWAWGNLYVLSSGVISASSKPTKVSDSIASASFGWDHNMVLKKDGSLWASGAPDNGKLGDGGNGNDPTRLIPIKVLDNVASVSAGRYHTIAVKQDGSLWAWGLNTSGHLGIGTSDFYKSTPVEVSFDNVASISVGNEHSMAIKQDGSLWAWGRNNYGQLGDGTDALKRSPVKVLDDVASVSAGGDHTMAIKLDGSLWACGDNQYGQIDDGATDIHYSFFKIADNVSSVSAGRYHTMAIKQDGSLWAWGRNNYGQLGDGTTVDKSSPIKVLDDVAYVGAGENNTIVIKNDGSIWAWGRNNIGQLGDGTTIDRLSPVKILDFDDTPDPVNFSITSYSPINDQTDVPLDTNIELTFNQDISSIDWQAANSIDNRIHLMHYDGSSNAYQGVEIDVSIKSGDSKTIIIKPSSLLLSNTDYFVRILPDTIKDSSNNVFSGLDITDYKFTTANVEDTTELHASFILNKDITGIENLVHTYKTDFDINDFKNPSSNYNHDIAKASMALSAAAYNSSVSTDKAKFINDALASIGFDKNTIKNFNYDKAKNDKSDTVAFTIGQQDIIQDGETYKLFVVVIRGTTDSEWYSNFNLANSDFNNDTYHEGFYKASEEVASELGYYIFDAGQVASKSKIWITGHSRGAAVANIVAQMYSSGKHSSYYDKNNIFAYTFATPRVATKTSNDNNIFNIVSVEDFVTHVPLQLWLDGDNATYGRNGVNYGLLSKETHSRFFKSEIVAFENKFNSITSQTFEWHTNGYKDMENFIDYILRLGPSVYKAYTQKNVKQRVLGVAASTGTLLEYFNTLADNLVSGNLLNINNLLLFGEDFGDLNKFIIKTSGQVPTMSPLLFFAHAPETYLAWMDGLDANAIFKMQSMLKYIVKCPVDVMVYDSQGNLVGQVINNIVDKNIANPVQIVVEGDEKTIYLCGDEEYQLKLVATDSGTMNCVISEMELLNGEERRINFYDIPLEINKTMTTIVNPSDIGEPVDIYDLSIENGGTITPNEVLEDDTLNNIEIQVTITGDGVVAGTQLLTKGDNAILVATPETDYEFDGWYENSIKIDGITETYSFVAMNSRTLEARFVPVSSTTYTITATAGTGGSVSGGGTFNENGTVNLVATSDSGYAFDGWYESGTKVVGATETYSFTATADRALEARFVLISSATTYTITATAGIGGSATGGGTFNENAAVTLIATPHSGYAFDGWYENGTKLAGAAAVYSFTATADRTLDARFVLISSSTTYTITATAGVGGSATGGGVFNENATVTLVATPNSGYAFNGWLENGTKIAGAAATYSFTATANRTLEARFVLSSNESNNSNKSSSGGGSGSTSNSSSSVTTDPLANLLSKIKTAVENALKEALSGQSAKAAVQIKNADKITLAMLKQASDTAKKAGSSITLHFDTMSADGQTVLSRLYIKPELATIDINVSMSETRANNVKSFFEQYFTNKIAVLSLEQPGSFGMQVEIAAKVDLTGMDTKNLYFYSYDKKTNTYRRIEKSAYWIDKNGYLHFTAELAGDIIISEKPLARK